MPATPTTCRRAAGKIFRLVLVPMILFGRAPTAVQALDFTLQPFTVDEDGVKHQHYSFQYDAHTAVVIDLPRGWRYTGDAGAIEATAPESASKLRLEKSSSGPAVLFKDKGIETYRHRVLADIPPGATDIQITEEHNNPLPIFGWVDYEFVVRYEFYGLAFRRSVVFVNLDSREQIVETITASPNAFAAVRDAGLDVLRSWQAAPAGSIR